LYLILLSSNHTTKFIGTSSPLAHLYLLFSIGDPSEVALWLQSCRQHIIILASQVIQPTTTMYVALLRNWQGQNLRYDVRQIVDKVSPRSTVIVAAAFDLQYPFDKVFRFANQYEASPCRISLDRTWNYFGPCYYCNDGMCQWIT
jgi:hypothetical protein